MEKEDVGRSCVEGNSVGEEQEFRAMSGSHWPSCGGGRIVGDAMCIFPCWDL